ACRRKTGRTWSRRCRSRWPCWWSLQRSCLFPLTVGWILLPALAGDVLVGRHVLALLFAPVGVDQSVDLRRRQAGGGADEVDPRLDERLVELALLDLVDSLVEVAGGGADGRVAAAVLHARNLAHERDGGERLLAHRA